MSQYSPSEWQILRVVWANPECTSQTIINTLTQSFPWSISTIKTLINRLLQKNTLTAKKEGKKFLYTASISETEALQIELEKLFDNVCQRNHGQILSQALNQYTFTKKEIQNLQNILQTKFLTAPEELPCNCIPGQCHCHKKGECMYE